MPEVAKSAAEAIVSLVSRRTGTDGTLRAHMQPLRTSTED
jgi:hypothetical protein